MLNLSDTDLEREVLAACLQNSADCSKVLGALTVKSFTLPAHRELFLAYIDYAQSSNEAFQLSTLVSKYKIGFDLLGSLDREYRNFDVNYCCDMLKKYEKLRQLVDKSHNFINPREDVEASAIESHIHKFISDIHAFFDKDASQGGISIKDANTKYKLVEELQEKVQKRKEGKPIIDCIQTGYYDLDKCISGFSPGRLYLVAARPSVGKTTLALNLLYNLKRYNTLFFSIEMTEEEIFKKFIYMTVGAPYYAMENGLATPEQIHHVYGALKSLESCEMHIFEKSNLTPFELLCDAKRYKILHNGSIDAIFVDYLQYMSSDAGEKYESNQVKIATISRRLKAIAKDLNVPVIALAQLNREVEGRTDKTPVLADLRESGSLEADADVALLLFDDPNKPGVLKINIAKNRFGEKRVIDLCFEKSKGRILNHADTNDVETDHAFSMFDPT